MTSPGTKTSKKATKNGRNKTITNVVSCKFSIFFNFSVSCIILIYCKYKCVKKSCEEAGHQNRLQCQHFNPGRCTWMGNLIEATVHKNCSNSTLRLVQETAQRRFLRPQLVGSTETVELGVVFLRVFMCWISFGVCFSKFSVNVKKYYNYISICYHFMSVVFLISVNKIYCMFLLHLFALSNTNYQNLSLLIILV